MLERHPLSHSLDAIAGVPAVAFFAGFPAMEVPAMLGAVWYVIQILDSKPARWLYRRLLHGKIGQRAAQSQSRKP